MSLGLFAAAVAVRLVALAISGLAAAELRVRAQARSLLAGEGYRLIQLGTPPSGFGAAAVRLPVRRALRRFGHRPLAGDSGPDRASSLIPVVIARIAVRVGLDRRLRWVAAATGRRPSRAWSSTRSASSTRCRSTRCLISLTVLCGPAAAPGAGSWTPYGTGGRWSGLDGPHAPDGGGVRPARAALWLAWAAAKAGANRRALRAPASPCPRGGGPRGPALDPAQLRGATPIRLDHDGHRRALLAREQPGRDGLRLPPNGRAVFARRPGGVPSARSSRGTS